MKTENLILDYLMQFSLRPYKFLKNTTLILIVFSIFSCASLNSRSYRSRLRAVDKITDQNVLYKVALDDYNYEVKIAAFYKITDQNLITRLAIKSSDAELCLLAFNKIADQNIIDKLAVESDDQDLQLLAINKVTDQDIIYKIALNDRNFNINVAAMKRLTSGLQAKLANESKDLRIKFKVVELCSDQIELMGISQDNDNWEVRKVAFSKLNSNSLDILTREAKDPAINLSANISLGRISWHEAFSGNSTPVTLGDFIGAAALVDTPQPTSADVVSACHNFIKLGDASRIPELIYLINKFGDKYLAEDYMNCGNDELKRAGEQWGRDHGYNVATGAGSNRVRWGSGK
jgi:hypothetical protein